MHAGEIEPFIDVDPSERVLVQLNWFVRSKQEASEAGRWMGG